MKREDILVSELARAESFRLLSELYNAPDDGLLENLEDLDQNLDRISSKASSLVRKMKQDLEEAKEMVSLKIDHAALFVGPFRLLAAPYGSVYLDAERRVMGDSTIEARACYRACGLDVSEDFRDAPDHIRAELEFLYFLIVEEMGASDRSELEVAVSLREMQRHFLRGHLGAWVPDFSVHVEKNAETPFYRDLGRMTRIFIEEQLREATKTPDQGPVRPFPVARQ